MMSIIILLNLLTESFRKKLADVFPVILSSPHREEEFFMIVDPMFDFIFRQTLKNAKNDNQIEKFATNTIDSFIQLLKFGFDDPTNMSYHTLHRKTSLILDKFFVWNKYINLLKIEWMYNQNTYNKLINLIKLNKLNKLNKRSDITYEVLRMYPFDDLCCWNGLHFSAISNSQCICLDVGGNTFAQLCTEDEIELFNLSDEIDPIIKMTDGRWTTRNTINDHCECIIGNFPEMEDKILKRKPVRSTKRKLRNQKNSIVFH